TQQDRRVARVPAYFLLWFNSVVLVCVFGMILWLALNFFKDVREGLVDVATRMPHPASMAITPDNSLLVVLVGLGCVLAAILAVVLIPVAAKISHQSIWSHPHFSGATLAQFFYVAAQAGIFSFLINYVVWEVPPLPASWGKSLTASAPEEVGAAKKKEPLVEVRTRIDKVDIKDLPSLVARLKETPDAVSKFVADQLSNETKQAMAKYDGSSSDATLRFHLSRDLDDIVARDTRSAKKKKPTLYDESRFNGIALQERTKELLARNPKGNDRSRLNRMLLADAYPQMVPFEDGILGFSNRAASFLGTLGFILFLTGRFTGAGLLRKYSAHKIVGLYATLNVVMCLLVFFKLGWISVACVFLSYFFMSIMFPTIFALGIFGLGERAKGASAYIVMAIMGGAMLPKAMGAVADRYDMSRGFIVPMVCFIVVALYGYGWPLLSKAKSLQGLQASGGH
ncbi:MAG: MFS transporter, partial [Thermoguttaceae bacterium]